MAFITLSRRAFFAAAAAAPFSTLAQDGRPLEWVVGYAAGGGSDAVARAVAEQLSKILGRTIIVTNKPGAATNISAEYVARAPSPDHVLFTADFATLAANPWLFSRLPYDPVKDFKSIGLLARFPLVLVVGPQVPAANFKEFIAWAGAAKDPVSFASSGVGSPQHLAGELFKQRSGLRLQHVPYRGGVLAVQDLVGGQVPFALMDTATVIQQIQAGKLRALGVASADRLRSLPDVPTLAEQGLAGFEAFAWQALVVPSRVPAEQVQALSRALQQALESDFVRSRFQNLAVEAMPGSPQQMDSFVADQRAYWGAVIKTANITLQ